MTTLLLRCAGPMQSWGTRSRFQHRDTEREPSKSGVLGLICAALGRDREDTLEDLAALRMGVRADREGLLEIDFHTARNVAKADGSRPETELSHRAYLADAVFLVGLEGDRALLQRIDGALASPVWPLSLGRKAFVPSESVRLPDGLCEEPLEEALERYPRLSAPRRGEDSALRLVLECQGDEEGELRRDVPLSFALDRRHFAQRKVRTRFVPAPDPSAPATLERGGAPCT